MTIFHFEVTEHLDQFGSEPPTEHGCVARCMDLARQEVASHNKVGDEASPTPLVLNGIIVGKFWWGADSHTVAEQKARAAAQAEADAEKASAQAAKPGKAA